MAEDYAKKLQSLLRKLFQFESADLDFGIYRIMNKKRDVINRFIEKDLIAAVDAEFGKVSMADKAQLLTEVEALAGELGIGVDDDPAALRAMAKKVPALQPLITKFEQKRTELLNLAGRDEHKAEVFNHIYQFFSRYYDNGDFMSMRRYSAKQKFAVPYNGEEVLLHWANKDQYYIKTGEYFFNYAFRVGEYTVRFQIVQAETSVNNTKGESRFFILKSGEGNISYNAKAKELVVLFEYRALTKSEEESLGTRNKQDALNEKASAAILAGVPDPGLKAGLTRETEGKMPLAKHLATYAKRNTTDYFIHKDLAGFLTQELDFYIKNEMFDLDDLGSEKEVPIEQYLNRVRVMKAISLKIIAFLAQIEDFQKKLFEKKKFVMKSEYCMTLDRVPEEFYPEIVKNAAQIAEWKTLYSVGESREQTTLSGSKGNVIDEEFLKSHPYLVLDTDFFPPKFKDRLLSTFDNLDEVTGGLMVKSENWQALNLLQERYREQVKCIYIDPPYNTGSDEGFLYKDNYMDSSWISMLFDRLMESALLLDLTGTIAISIDIKEISNLIQICDNIFGKENRRAIISVKRSSVTGPKVINKGTVNVSEYVIIYSKNFDKWNPNAAYKERKRDDRYSTFIENRDKPVNEWVFIPLLDAFSKVKGLSKRQLKIKFGENFENEVNKFVLENVHSICRFTNLDESKRSAEAMDLKPISENDPAKVFILKREGNSDVYIKNGNVILFYEDRVIKIGDRLVQGELLTDIWDDVLPNDLHNEGGVSLRKGKKPEKLINRIFDLYTEKNDLILDFFVGSGTASGVAQKTGRFFIAIDSESYFDNLAIRRMKNTLNGESSGISKQFNWKGGGCFKYLTLEQYEDTLNNIEFQDAGTVQKTLMDLDGYFLRYMLDFETRESPCRMNVAKLEQPFNYRLQITRDSELHEETVDLVETFNYLLGLKVKRIRTFTENGTTYRIVHGETLASEPTTIVWRTTTGLDLKKDKEFIEGALLKDPKFRAERVFINSDFHVEGALPIEPEFQRLMDT
jgi:adenine-specific DNA-methyltransferase